MTINLTTFFPNQLSLHCDVTSIAKAFKDQVYIWLLPMNYSHWLQPLDSMPFAAYKYNFGLEYIWATFESSFFDTKEDNQIFSCAYREETIIFSPDIIKAGFCCTGMFPFNLKLI